MNPVEQVRQAIHDHGRPAWIAHVPMSIIRQVPPDTLNELITTGKPSNPHSREKIMVDWLAASTGTTHRTDQLAHIMGVSMPTIRKFINEHRGWFRKAGHGVWEIINPTEAHQ